MDSDRVGGGGKVLLVGVIPSRLEAWERRADLAVTVVPYVALAMSAGVALVLADSWQTRWVTLGATVAAALWLVWFSNIRPIWSKSEPVLFAYFAGLIAIYGLLVWCSPIFGFFAIAVYIQAMRLKSRTFMVTTAASAITAVSQIGGFANLSWQILPAYLLVFGFNALIVGTFVMFGMRREEQNIQMRTLIEELEQSNRKLETTMAENAGLHAQLVAQAREGGVHDERQRMAREIHDTLAQGLTGIITQLEAAEHAHDKPEIWKRHLGNAATLARDSLGEARRSVHAVRPEPLETARLPEAVADVAGRWSTLHEVVTEVTTTGDPQPLHPEIEIALLRIAQEALANVAKHANASRVGLTLSYMGDVVTLDVRDDGRGFDVEDPTIIGAGAAEGGANAAERRANGTAGGFGLTGMRQRIDRLDGSLEIESEPGGGTAVSASVPAIRSEVS